MKKSLIVLLLCTFLLTAACGKTAAPNADVPVPEESVSAQTDAPDASDALTTEASAGVETTVAETTAPEETAAETTEDTGPVRVSVHWADAVPKDLLKAPQYMVLSGENSTWILFKTNRTAQDFRILSLKLLDVDDNGKVSYQVDPALHIGALAPGQPVAVQTVFYGDIPNNGFSYVDENGDTQYFALSISGEDGSLEAEPFTP